MSQFTLEIDSPLSRIPQRTTHKPVVVLKFGGTTVGSTPDEGRIKTARLLIADYLERGLFVVPVFSAFRRGRSGSSEKVSITDRLQSYASIIEGADRFEDGVATFRRLLQSPHEGMLHDLKLQDDRELRAELDGEIDHLVKTAALCCRAHESIPSLDAELITGGERLATRILSAYFNRLHADGRFPLRTARVTGAEMGLFTDSTFRNASIDWSRAVEHAREVLLGKYLEAGVLPIVTGFDGIYDPDQAFAGMMRDDALERSGSRFSGVYRTALGRGGSDLTATFLGLALGAQYVGFVKETPGVLSGDDMLVGESAQTIPELDYDLATEAGNIYPKAVEPVRAGKVPVHIFDPRAPEHFTAIHDVSLSDGLYLITHPVACINVHVGAVPDEPGELVKLLEYFARFGLDVAEVRHQRSGTDLIVEANEQEVSRAIDALEVAGYRPQPTHIWYLRVVGNITPQLCMAFNEFVSEFHPLSSASFQVGTKALTVAFPRNRVGTEEREEERIHALVKRIHDELVVPNLGRKVSLRAFGGQAVG
ncbi:MAG: hypothetical protein R3B40_25220 [Polyangiales bacterium]|nr:hypothetical protein [Myxococcales bacterium]MCB9661958.1 hypothetical protein [Sandaracinaceae bacterium]